MSGGRRAMTVGWLVLSLGFGLPCVRGAAEPVKAQITLQSKQVLNVELLGRETGGFVMLREPGKVAEVGFRITDFVSVNFQLEEPLKAIDAKLVAQDLRGAADDLGKLLKPLYPYIDLPCDVPKYASLYMKLLMRTRQFEEAVTTSYLLNRYSKDEALRREAQAYRVVGLIELGRLNTVETEMKPLLAANITRRDDVAGPYFYALARLQMLQTNWAAAHLSAANIIAFRPRDFEWMPAGLYLSAQCYGADAKFDVAQQIIDEIRTAYPKSPWAELAAKLGSELTDKQLQLEKAKPKE